MALVDGGREAMTREDWINRYIAAMLAGGSTLPELQLRAHAENACDCTEQHDQDPADWEDPETIASEDLLEEHTDDNEKQ
jgi:hypothetical protein